ncbi:MAG: ABC transporter ATP-binding protein [Rhodobacteraceae bacterium]|nr:ABC transporter ATP-binding protein [Paracoccaceae bacterium]MCF8514556.1 ABC transporter ATP-binding protein [Paracoccaceae bacterium]MCF8518903.1 ABC transporter ATP-binding protein [Paracoccaceae bacterium]
MSLLHLTNLTVRRGECPVVDDVSLTVKAGEFVGLLGPNGAGKTTLLRACLGLIPHEGKSNLSALPARTRARAVAFLPQGREIAWPVAVGELVALAGRGQGATDRAMARMGLAAYRDRSATALSGGEQARVLIARALAQDTPLLLADEPAAGLDPEAQIRTCKVFQDLASEGRGVVASLHDLGLAARHCTRLVLMARGRLVADGPPREVLSETNLAEVFGVRGFHAETPLGPVFQPMDVIR